MNSKGISQKLKAFETQGWKTRDARRVEGTLCQLRILRASNLAQNKLGIIANLESKLLSSLISSHPNSELLTNCLAYIYARQIVSEFL